MISRMLISNQFMFALSPVFVQGAMQDSLDTFQNIRAGKEQTDHRNRCIKRQDRPGTSHNQELGDESIQTRQAQRSHAGKDQDSTIDWHEREQSAKVIQVAGVGALVKNTHKEEHAGRRKTVVEHLQHCAIQGDGGVKGARQLWLPQQSRARQSPYG